MTILGVNLPVALEAKYPPARKAFGNWRRVVEQAKWANLIELQGIFSSADYVAPYIVFNIGGNKYRIIALVKFPLQLLQIEEALTHEQYNDWKPKKKS
jgi:mRNA interferase HigB